MRSKPFARPKDQLQGCSPVAFENFLVWTPSGFRAADETLLAPTRPEPEPEFYGQSAGIRAKGLTEVMGLLNKGLPLSAFDRLSKSMGLSVIDLGRIAKISLRTIRRRKQEGKLTPEESERVYRIACVFDKALDVFADAGLAREWFKTPLIALGGKTPLDFCTVEVGAREVETLLGRIEHGVFS
jgi:putative toxin-antitoxin system antitoxin component (TIGR02293 family)